MNAWATGFLGRSIVDDWQSQLDVTTKIFRARGLHLDDRHVRRADGHGFSASIVDAVLYVVNNHAAACSQRRIVDRALPAEDPDRGGSSAVARHPLRAGRPPVAAGGHHQGLRAGRAGGGVFSADGDPRGARPRFVGFNTGRWDYINSVSDAMAWDPSFVNPNIDAITMTYGYMRHYEDRVRRAVNTPDRAGQCALWQGGMEPNIPVGSEAGVQAGMARARWPAPNGSSARAPAASGSRTGRWSTSSGPCGSGWGRTTSWAIASRLSATPHPTRMR